MFDGARSIFLRERGQRRGRAADAEEPCLARNPSFSLMPYYVRSVIHRLRPGMNVLGPR